MSLGVDRILKSMMISPKFLRGNASQVYKDFGAQAAFWVKKQYEDKYFLEVIEQGKTSSPVENGKIPLTILKTDDGEFFPLRRQWKANKKR